MKDFTMHIQVLGSGCFKCKKLFQNVEAALKRLSTSYTLEKVTDLKTIIAMGTLITPALAIDGKIVSAGKILSEDEILAFLQA